MKRSLPFIISLFVVLVTSFALLYPHTLIQAEANDFFLFTSDFAIKTLSVAPGLTNWLECYLLQFFANPFVGATILGLVITATCLPVYMLCRRLNIKDWLFVVIMPSCLSAIMFNTYLQPHIQIFAFFSIIYVSIWSKRMWLRIVMQLLLLVPAYMLIPFPLLIITYVLIALAELLLHKSPKMVAIQIIAICISFLLPIASSNNLDFIAFADRYFVAPISDTSLWIYALYVLPIVFALAVKNMKHKPWLDYGMSLILIIAIIATYISNDIRKENEGNYEMMQAAEAERWDDVLSHANDEDIMQNPLKMRIILLAYSAQGKLAETAFRFSINSPEQFLFLHQLDATSCYFNELFYKNIGIYDEAFHQAFEYGVISKNNMCFRSMRAMTRYATEVGDKRLAQKYIDILSNSSANSSWIEEAETRLTKNYKAPTNNRTKSLINCFRFNSEMVRLLQDDTTSQKKLDYLLVGLLLEKKLDNFTVILDYTPIYKGKQIPLAYAEAAAMLHTQGQDLHTKYIYDRSYDEKFREYYAKYQSGTTTNIPGSYWTYFFTTQIEESSPNQ